MGEIEGVGRDTELVRLRGGGGQVEKDRETETWQGDIGPLDL